MTSVRRERLRLITWPLAMFLLGTLATFPPKGPDHPLFIIGTSAGIGLFYAIPVLILALILNPFLPPTKTVLPFADGRTGRGVLFLAFALEALILKALGLFGMVSGVSAVIAAGLVMWGRKAQPSSSL